MKTIFLFLVLATSCGKHTTPPAQDLGDDDGDGVRNNVDSSRYISEEKSLGKISGKLRIKTELGKKELLFHNSSDQNELGLSLISFPALNKPLRKENLNTGRLQIDSNFDFLPREWNYEIEVKAYYDSNSPAPMAIGLYHSGKMKVLSRWSTLMKISLDRNELDSLLAGYSSLHALQKLPTLSPLEKKNERKIYRVYYFDGKKRKTYRVSRKLHYQNFLKRMNVSGVSTLRGIDFFFEEADTQKTWWSSQISESEYVLAYTSLSELRDTYKSVFNIQQNSLSRKDGKNGASIELRTIKGAYVLLELQSSRVTNIFSLRKSKKDIKLSPYVIRECKKTERLIKKTSKNALSLAEIKNDFRISIGGIDYSLSDLNAKIEYSASSKKWKVAFISPGEDISMNLISRPKNTYFNTGLIAVDCGKLVNTKAPSLSKSSANSERSASLSVISFLEKTEDSM